MPRSKKMMGNTGNIAIFCVKCKSKTGTSNPKHVQSQNGRHMIQGQCSNCGTKKTMFVSKEHVANGLLGKLFGMEKIPLLGDLPLVGALF